MNYCSGLVLGCPGLAVFRMTSRTDSSYIASRVMGFIPALKILISIVFLGSLNSLTSSLIVTPFTHLISVGLLKKSTIIGKILQIPHNCRVFTTKRILKSSKLSTNTLYCDWYCSKITTIKTGGTQS